MGMLCGSMVSGVEKCINISSGRSRSPTNFIVYLRKCSHRAAQITTDGFLQ